MHHGLHGDLIGHVFPGVAFLLWAALWARDMLRRGGGDPAFAFDLRPLAEGAAPLPEPGALERWLKVLLPLLGVIGDARWITFPMTSASVSDFQHITAYVAVSLSGVTDMLVQRAVLPRAAGALMLALTFAVAAFTLAFHGHHMVVAETVHLDLAFALLAVAVLTVLELVRPAPLVRWLRIYALTLSATWFFQVGWMLYVAMYDLESDDVAVRAHMFFSWHLIGVALALLAFVGLTPRGRTTARTSS